MAPDPKMFRHKHLYTFLNFWDENHDGILSWEDFELLAEKFAKIQRRGKLEKEILDRWKAIFQKWWNELTSHADENHDTVVEFEEWLKFFNKLGQTTKTYEELPEFLKVYLQLFFLCSDANTSAMHLAQASMRIRITFDHHHTTTAEAAKDGLFCLKDYKKYMTGQKMDTSKAEEHFKFMLDEKDSEVGNAFTSDRFKELVYDFWVSSDSEGKGKYICGPFDLIPAEELEAKVKKV